MSSSLTDTDKRVISLTDESEVIFHRQPDGSLRPSHAHRCPPVRECSEHGEYDAGMDGHCVRCRKKIAPRMVIIIEDNR